VWATERYYSLLGVSFHVRSEDAAVGDAVDRLLEPFRRDKSGVPGRRRYALVTGKDAYGAHTLYRDCSSIARRDSWAYVVSALVSEMNRGAVEAFDGFAVHAGVVAAEGGVIAFPADSGDGKSTLTAACLQAGFEYVSDEALCLDYATEAVLPYPKPVMLSADSEALVGNPSPTVALEGDHVERALLPEDLGSRAATGDLQLVDVVQLQRTSGPPHLHELPAADVVAMLLGRSFNHYKHPREAFDLVTGLARRCRAWRLEYDDPGAAAALMLDRLGRAVTTTG
jgi:hypothetical protein